jgi:hypothetical protein
MVHLVMPEGFASPRYLLSAGMAWKGCGRLAKMCRPRREERFRIVFDALICHAAFHLSTTLARIVPSS